MRTLEHTPDAALFQVNLQLEFSQSVLDRWKNDVLQVWSPGVLMEKAVKPDYQQYHHSQKALWPGNYCDLRISERADPVVIIMEWIPGNPGAGDAFALVTLTLQHLRDKVTATLSFAGDGCGMQCEDTLDHKILQKLMGDSQPQWRLKKGPGSLVESFGVRVEDGIVFEQLS